MAFVSLLDKRVKLHGLQARPELNGTEGDVRAFDATTDRYEVHAGPDTILKIKAANLDVIGGNDDFCSLRISPCVSHTISFFFFSSSHRCRTRPIAATIG
jgi:hypothetical protein